MILQCMYGQKWSLKGALGHVLVVAEARGDGCLRECSQEEHHRKENRDSDRA